MQPAVKDTSQIYQVERREYYATRPVSVSLRCR